MRSILYIALMLVSMTSFAQNFEVNVSKKQVAVGERFSLEYKTELAGANFTPPNMQNIQVLSGPNMSESSLNINGKRSRSFTVSYVLRAQQEGEAKIGPATLTTKNETFTSEAITLQVTKQAQNKTQTQGENDLSSTMFIKLFVDDKNPYVGEQIVATYKIYMAEQLVNYSSNNPVFNGFYAQNIDLSNSSEVSKEFINNRQFTVATLKKVILTPQKSGTLEVDPIEMELRVRLEDKSRGRSFFGFPSYKEVNITVASNTEKINVKPLPSSGQPAGFDGAVGNFTLSAIVDRTDLNANEAVNLTVMYSGNGNIELLSEPKINFPADFEVYDPKVRKNISNNASGSSGKKTFEYVIIPRFGGDFELEPIKLSYFDPSSGKYKTLESEPITLHVAKGANSTDAAVYNPTSKEDVQILGKDIRFIKTENPDLARSESSFFKTQNFYLLSALPVGLGGTFWIIMLFLRRKEHDQSLTSKRAGGVAKKHLAKATKLINDKNEAFYEAISKALFGYLSDKLSINLAELNRENIESELKAKNVSQVLITQLTKALDECDMVRFAPGVVRGKEEMLAASKEIIEKLEDEL
ncbi:MAG: BatD family protein [Salibacteraceae bacterium]|nr:BatD family protein [Salibacteraceae bacterium]MDP4763986.1 BatD family protein [Salibacteraceae bacterium]MDP4843744.1 BatD family protein [Salibacteraceae bacterium]MDP4964147.1 BatD family protein [Salibacteraceae bacterium]